MHPASWEWSSSIGGTNINRVTSGPKGTNSKSATCCTKESGAKGYGSEAVAAALEWAGASLPDPDVILCTQLANRPSRRLAERLGFVEAGRFTAYDAEQWLGTRRLPGH